MEPFDVLNMVNTIYSNLEHSNCYIFYLFKFWDPFISPKKILPIIRFVVLKKTGLSPRFQRKKLVLRYDPKCVKIQVAEPNL